MRYMYLEDVVTVSFWLHQTLTKKYRISLYNMVMDNHDNRSRYYSTKDDDEIVSGDWIAWLIVPPLIGAVTLVLGSIFGFMSICRWPVLAAPDVQVQVSHGPTRESAWGFHCAKGGASTAHCI